MLARLEQALREKGYRDFEFVIVGEGAESEWLTEQYAAG